MGAVTAFPNCNSLRGSGLKAATERHLSAQNYTLLKHIKSHLVGHPAARPRKPLLLPGKVCAELTLTQERTMGIILLWLAELPCAAAIILVSLSAPPPPEGPFCMRAGFVYATIEFTASLNLCLSFRFRIRLASRLLAAALSARIILRWK